MPFARFTSTIRLAASASFFAMLTLACLGQEPPAAPTPQNTPETRPVPVLNYGKAVSHFPNPIGPYTARHVSAPNLANTARIDQLMHDGKLYLSLNDAVALALENNLDIAIQRYNLNIADTDVLRAKSGASILGVNAGVVLNTPGGGVGGIGANSGAGNRRHQPGRGRRRRRHQRLGKFHPRHRTGHQQLRSRPHWNLARGSLQSTGDQHFSGRSSRHQPGAKHRHGEFRVPAGFPMGHEPEHRIQQHARTPPTASFPA